jgi:tRNA A37 threonylcarbamoyladenosine biosynthesis protein TsaE
MGVDEYLYSGNWCFIEWAENIPNLIPDSIPLLPKGIARRQAFIRIVKLLFI